MNIKNKEKLRIGKGKIYSFFSKLGSSMIVPISLLPFLGVLISIGNLFSFFNVEIVGMIFMNFSIIIFSFFPILVFLSIVYNFEKEKSGKVLIWSLIFIFSFFVFNDLFFFLFQKLLPNLIQVDFNLFLGISLGLIFFFLYKNFLTKRIEYKIIPVSFLISFFVFLLSFLFYFLIYEISTFISILPFGMNSFLYGFVNRIFLPFGLHTILIPIFLYSIIGGSLYELNNLTGVFELVAKGDSSIWMYAYINEIPFQMIDKFMGSDFIFNGTTYFITDNTNPGQYQQGFFPIMIFCFPAAGFSLSKNIDDPIKKKVIIMISFIPMLTGITEPFEFLFVFSSFTLYIFHAFMTGISFMLLSLLNVNVWLSTGWVFDVALYGVLPSILNGMQTNYYYILVVGIFLSPIYYFFFKKINIDIEMSITHY